MLAELFDHHRVGVPLMSFHVFLYTSDWIKSRGFSRVRVMWRISLRREDVDHGLFYKPHYRRCSVTLVMSFYTTTLMWDPGWIFRLQLIIFKCTSTKIKSEKSERAVQHEICSSSSFLLPNLHFTLRRVSDWVNKSVSPFFVFCSPAVFSSTAQTHTHAHARAHTHPPTHDDVQFPVKLRENILWEKETNKQKK